MVQILESNKKPSFMQRLGVGVERGVNRLYDEQQQQKSAAAEAENKRQLMQEQFGLKSGLERQKMLDKLALLEHLKGSENKPYAQQLMESEGEEFSENSVAPSEQEFNAENEALSLLFPEIARDRRSAEESRLRKEKYQHQKFLEERKYHTDYSKKAEENISKIHEMLPGLENSLDLVRDSVESGNVGAFSWANLSRRLGLPELQSAKGKQLETAVKENLLSNMSRVSARAQNIWFEQRLNSMIAQAGTSKEANLSAQEVLEAELAMKRSYLTAFERIAEEDEQKYGYVRKDAEKRAHAASKPLEKQVFDRQVYRLKDLEEQEKGDSSLKKSVGQKVTKGTPLTIRMAKFYKEKFGDKALEVAKKNGYFVPTVDEVKLYMERPREYRETL